MRNHFRHRPRWAMTLLLALALGAAPSIGCEGSAAQPTSREPTASSTATFRVKEMACHGCAERIDESLRKHTGVSKVAPDLKAAQVAVTFDPTKTTSAEIKQALDKLGFPATLVSERKTESKAVVIRGRDQRPRLNGLPYAAPRPSDRSASTLILPAAQQSASWPLTTTAGTR